MAIVDKDSKVGRFIAHVVPGVIRPLRVLWHEVFSFIFIVLALWAAPSVYREYKQFADGTGSFSRILVPLGWVLVMGYFGVTSYLRGRKISRS
jgi:hypothetical protein